MKRYIICLFLFVGVSGACLIAGHFLTRQYQNTSSPSAAESEIETMGTVETTETVPENLAAANKNKVRHEMPAPKGEFYRVSEDGFLLEGPGDDLPLYPHPSDGFSGEGAGTAAGRNLVSGHDGCDSLS